MPEEWIFLIWSNFLVYCSRPGSYHPFGAGDKNYKTYKDKGSKIDFKEFRDVKEIEIEKLNKNSVTLLFDHDNNLEDKLIIEQFEY